MSQVFSKGEAFSIRLMSDADRRRRFIEYFNGPPLNGDRQRLIKKSGFTEGRISQLFDPSEPFGERAAKSLAGRLNIPDLIFLRDGVAYIAEVKPPPKGLAHNLSESTSIVFPTTIEWGDWMNGPLPESFALKVKDDSMSDDYEVGDLVFFKTATLPTPGKKVLVVDRDGNGYIRKYRMRNATHWEAVATNPNYATLDALKEGLQVIAVAHGSYRD